MTIALGLIAYGLLMSTFGSRALARLTAQGHAPRFAVAAWCSACLLYTSPSPRD